MTVVSTPASSSPAMRSLPSGAHMRQVLSRVPTSVCVVATTVDGAPAGSVVGTFTSVSLDPPLIAFFSMPTSDTLAAVRAAGSFAVNVLAADQQETCGVFAVKSGSRFDAVPWRLAHRGNPHLTGALAVLECELESATEVGDHVMILGRVVELEALRTDADPLVFWAGGFHGLRPPTYLEERS